MVTEEAKREFDEFIKRTKERERERFAQMLLDLRKDILGEIDEEKS